MGYNGCVSNGVDGSNSFIAGLSDKSRPSICDWTSAMIELVDNASLGYETPIYDNLDIFGTGKGPSTLLKPFQMIFELGCHISLII